MKYCPLSTRYLLQEMGGFVPRVFLSDFFEGIINSKPFIAYLYDMQDAFAKNIVFFLEENLSSHTNLSRLYVLEQTDVQTNYSRHLLSIWDELWFKSTEKQREELSNYKRVIQSYQSFYKWITCIKRLNYVDMYRIFNCVPENLMHEFDWVLHFLKQQHFKQGKCWTLSESRLEDCYCFFPDVEYLNSLKTLHAECNTSELWISLEKQFSENWGVPTQRVKEIVGKDMFFYSDTGKEELCLLKERVMVELKLTNCFPRSVCKEIAQRIGKMKVFRPEIIQHCGLMFQT